MKRLFLFCAAICFLFICVGCASNVEIEEEPKLSPEAQLMWDHFSLKDIVQHNSLNELLENCATEDIKSVMSGFSTDKYEQIYYFNTFYRWDDDLNFPTSVIAFETDGATYYFAGSEQHNPFVPDIYNTSITYAAKNLARAFTVKIDNWNYSCLLSYSNSEGEYALSPISQVDADAYFNVLAEIVGAEFRCVANDYIHIQDNTVSVTFTSRNEFDELTYSLSNPDVLRETSFRYEKGEWEIVDYSSDDEAIGSDLVKMPDYLVITFETAGVGRTVLELLGDGTDVLYSIEIEVDEELGAFLPDQFK